MQTRPTLAMLVLALAMQLLLPTAAWQAHGARRDPTSAKAAAKGERPQHTPGKSTKRTKARGQPTPAVAAAKPASTAPSVGGHAQRAKQQVAKVRAAMGVQSRRLLATPKLIGKSLRQTLVTEERPVFDWSGFGFGVEFGLTLSEFHQVRDVTRKGLEVVHVSNYDGTSNVETVLSRWRLNNRSTRRIELQGPALNTDAGSVMPLGLRVVGLGLTDDMVDPNAHEAISYTFEVKATERTLIELVLIGVPVLHHLLPSASFWSTAVAQGFSKAIPLISASVALTTLWRAWKVFRNPSSTRGQRVMVTSHATADVIRVFAPLVGTILSASLVTFFGAEALIKARRLLRAGAAELPGQGQGAPNPETNAPEAYGANEAAAST